jgi:PAS domain S-box-containing protein
MWRNFQYIVGLLALVVLIFIFSISFYLHKDTEEKINNQFAQTRLIMVKFAAHEVKENIDMIIDELESITGNPDTIKMEMNNIPDFVKNNLNEVMHSGIANNLILIDGKEIIYNFPEDLDVEMLKEDYDLSVLDKYEAVLKNGKPVLSDVYWLKSNKNERAASLYVPLLSAQGELKGVAGALVNIYKIRKKYLPHIGTLNTYHFYLLDEEGKHIETSCKDWAGHHFYTRCKDTCCTLGTNNPTFLRFVDRVLTEKEGTASFVLKIGETGQKDGYKKRFAAFSDVNVANRAWHAIVSIPYEEITFLVQKNFHYILIILVVTILFVVSVLYLMYEINKKSAGAKDPDSHMKPEDVLKSELSEEKYKKVMEEALEGIAIFKGIELIEVNGAWANMFDTTTDKCIGMSIHDFVHYNSIDIVKDYFSKDTADIDEHPIQYDITVTTKKGKKRIHNVSMSRLSSAENMICMVSRDVTEKRVEEEEIHDAKMQLEKANKELDFYINSIVHDIKNPLITAQGFINVLVNEFCKKGNEQKDVYVQKIHSNISHIYDLLGSLLELSKIGRVKQHIERIDIKKEISMVKGYLSSFIEEKKAVILIKNDLQIVYTDKTLLTQILQNLLSNAIKFCKKDIPPVIEIGSKDIGDYIQFYVKDNGIGIDNKHYDSIFKVFGRINPDIHGSGVGLNVVKKAVEELGGELDFESKPGVGTTFYFTIQKKKSFFYLKELRNPI